MQFPQTSMHYAAAPLLGGRLGAGDGVSSSPAPTPLSAMVSPTQYQLNQHAFSAVPVQLWMGDIEPWMDEECIRQIWVHMGELVSVKTIRDRLTGGPANYCFIEVPTQAEAERILALYNGKNMPLPFDRPFRLNWASGIHAGSLFSSAVPAPAHAGLSTNMLTGPLEGAGSLATHQPAADADTPEHSLFVGDLAPEVTDVQLAHEFRCRYASARTAKVVTDPITQLSRGFGFMRFGDDADRQRALVEMQGHVIGSRAIRVSAATPKRTPTMGSYNYSHGHHASDANGREGARSPALSESSAESAASYNPATDPHNTTVFVGGLMNPVGEDELHNFFAVYGEVNYCKIPPNRGCGFVTFAKRAHAETAMRALNGHVLGGSRVRLSWGRSQSHARHNYRNHHRQSNSRHHHQNCHSNGGSASGTTSHRNSVSEQHNLYSRRSISFGKNPVSAAPNAAQPAALGLGLSGAPIPSAAPSAAVLGVPSVQPHGLMNMDMLNAQPSPGLLGSSYLGGAPLGQQQPQQPSLGEHMAHHSAFYTISPAHPAAGTGMEGFGGASATPLVGQAFGYYYPQQQQQQQPPGLAMHASSQLDSMHAMPGLAGPSDLLTRRLSALTLNSSNNGSTVGAAQPPALDRRASAGVIGERRLSNKPSFSQPPPQPQKAVSQLSLAQLWPQTPTLGDFCAGGQLPQLNDYQGALSTPASSARLSTSSLSLLALQPAGTDHDGSAHPSLDEQPRRRDQLDFELSGAV
ncbi:hypothetical protein IWW54_004573 [Coemansia sp. RSA 2705]|nr:hypothetical protein IWW54_004573 [Coemansia sp. RSA 2705]